MSSWPSAATGRNEFADMIESLDAGQLEQQTFCDAWTARGVLAHVTSFVETGFFGFFGFMVKSRFDFGKVSIAMADAQLARSTDDLVAALRSKAAKSSAMPMFPEELTVADITIHAQDVRRPLGLDGQPSETLLRPTLEFLTTHKMATTLVDRRPIDGIQLVATDMDWSFGSGPEISGTAEALMMGLANRPVLTDLSGEGLSNWG